MHSQQGIGRFDHSSRSYNEAQGFVEFGPQLALLLIVPLIVRKARKQAVDGLRLPSVNMLRKWLECDVDGKSVFVYAQLLAVGISLNVFLRQFLKAFQGLLGGELTVFVGVEISNRSSALGLMGRADWPLFALGSFALLGFFLGKRMAPVAVSVDDRHILLLGWIPARRPNLNLDIVLEIGHVFQHLVN